MADPALETAYEKYERRRKAGRECFTTGMADQIDAIARKLIDIYLSQGMGLDDAIPLVRADVSVLVGAHPKTSAHTRRQAKMGIRAIPAMMKYSRKEQKVLETLITSCINKLHKEKGEGDGGTHV